MTEPITIDEMLEWVWEASHPEEWQGRQRQIKDAIRAILEEVKTLRSNMAALDPQLRRDCFEAIIQITGSKAPSRPDPGDDPHSQI